MIVRSADPVWPARRVLVELLPVLIAIPLIVVAWDMVDRPVLLGLAGVCYAIVCARQPVIGLALAMAFAPSFHDIGGMKTQVASSDLMLAFLLPISVYRARFNPWRYPGVQPLLAITAIYLAVSACSMVIRGFDHAVVRSILQMALYQIAIPWVLICCVRRREDIVLGLWMYVLTSLVVAVAVLVTGQMFVLGLHKNASGTILCMAVLVAFNLVLRAPVRSYRDAWPWTVLGLLVLGLIISLSRGAWIGCLAGMMVSLAIHRRMALGVKMALVLIPIVALGWSYLPAERRELASKLERGTYNIDARFQSFDYAMDLFTANPLLGVGIGLRKEYDATNLVAGTLAESGLVGGALFFSIFGVIGWLTYSAACNLRDRPDLLSILAIGAGVVIAKITHGMVDHYWSRGLTIPSLGVGMILFCYAVSLRLGGASTKSR